MPSWQTLLKAVALIDMQIFRKLASEHEAPPSKRQKLAASLPASPQDPSSPNISQNYKRWHKMLVDFYLEDDSLSLTWPPLQAGQFVRLSLVKQEKRARHIDLKTVYGKIDEVYGDKTNVGIKDVFDGMVFRSLILFEGRPGSGKTTLMIKISREWANGELFRSKLVVFVQLRHLNEEEDVDLCNLIGVACKTLSPDDIHDLTAYIKGTLGEGVVFILDGFDEYAPGSEKDNFIYKLIAKYVFPESIVIVSSRPAATQPFRQKAARWIEVVGFMKKEIKHYIYSYYEDNKRKAKKLMKHLKHHPNLMNLCYLPLHCAMLVFLCEENMILPKTETEFYHDFTLSTLVRCYCKKFGKPPSNYFSSLSDLPPDQDIVFSKICTLAFEATASSKQVFKKSELQKIHFDDINEDSSGLGLVVIDRYFVKVGLSESYTFLHLTLQEYLAAVYISRLSPTEEQEAIIKEHGNKPNLFETWRFLFGTLNYAKDTTVNIFKLMMTATQEVGNSCNLCIQCAYESQSDLACSHVTDFYKNKLTFSEFSLISTDVTCIIHLLKRSKCTDIHLSFNKCILSVDDATALLQGIGNCQLSLTLKGDNTQQEIFLPLVHALNIVPIPTLVHLEFCRCYESLEEYPNPKNIANLQVLKFDHASEIAGLEECFQHWPKLKELYMCNYLESAAYAEAVIKELKHCPQLERLTLCGYQVEGCLDESACRALGEALQCLPNLQHINLVGNVNIGDSGIAHLTKELTHCTHLKELNLGSCFIGDSGTADLAKGLAHCGHLENLDLSNCDIGDSGVADLAKGLAHCVHLEKLNLYRNPSIGDSGMAHLAKGLTHCTRLKELDVAWCYIGNSGVADLAEGLTHCVHLEKLDLDQNSISDTVGKVLLESLLMNCKDIRELNLDRNRLTNKSIPCLVKLIKLSRNLEKLVLVKIDYANKFTEGGWSQLVEAVEHRNSTEGMSQLELVGFPTVESEEESNEPDS